MESEIKEDFSKYAPSDPELIDKIVNIIKSKGIFDQFRKDCLADVDTKPAYQNLQRRVNGSVNGFLNSQKWPNAQNKTQLRESVRKHTVKQPFLESGVDRIVDQVVMPKIYSVFHPKVEEIVYDLFGLERPKPKPKPSKSLIDLKLDFQNFKKSLEESMNKEEKEPVADRGDSSPAPSSVHNEGPQVPTVKEEEESLSNQFDAPNTPPPRETNGDVGSDAPPEVEAGSPASQKSASEVQNIDDDSSTIDEMPLLAPSMDTNSNRATTPILGVAKNDSIPKVDDSISKVDDSSDSDSISLPSSHPLEFDSSTNNLSSMKSDCKVSPTKKFDNFSNLGEKLKQSDVNLRETTSVKAEDITEESSEVTKSSEHDSESVDMNVEAHSDSNASALDNSKYALTKSETLASSHLSDDSMSSSKSKSKSQDSKKDDKNHVPKQTSENKSKSTSREQTIEPVETKDKLDIDSEKERTKSKSDKDRTKADSEKEHPKSSNRHSDSKSKRGESSREKSKSHRHREDKHRSKDSHSSERNGKHDSGKDTDAKKEKNSADSDEKKDKSNHEKRSSKHKYESSKSTTDDSDRKKKKEEKSRPSKEERDSRSSKKGEDAKDEEKEKDKLRTPEKEKKSDEKSRSDRHKSKSESSRSGHSKSGDKKSRDERHSDDKKHREDKKDKDDDKKRESRKRKNGKCDESDSKSKNSRRSSDRDSNGNAGGGSDKSKPTGSSQTPKKSSKSEQKTRSRYKDPSNSDAIENPLIVNDEIAEVTDEVDLILLEINNSIENEAHRVDVREILNEPSAALAIKPKIAKNFSEIRKIMQARKSISRSDSKTLPSESESLPDNKEPVTIDPGTDKEDGNDSLSRVELKNITVVVKDVVKGFSKTSQNLGLDHGSDVSSRSFFLGSNDEIVGVKERSVVSEMPLDDICYIEPSSMEESPGKSKSDLDTSDESVHVITETNEKVVPEKPSETIHADKSTAEVPVSSSADSKLSTKLVEAPTRDDADDDNRSIKSERSDSSHPSQKESADCDENDSKSSRKLERVAKQSVSSPLPSRSTKRKNAGTRMYAILEEVSSSKHSNAPADQGLRKTKAHCNSDDESHSEPGSQKVLSDKGETSAALEVSRSKETTDDGSDVSNKENDETSASGTGRFKNPKADQPTSVETRSNKKKNAGQEKPDESFNPCKPDKNTAKTRVSQSSKNVAIEQETVDEDNDSDKPSVDPSRTHARIPNTLLNSKVRDPEEECPMKSSPPSSSKSNDAIRKSLECLQMEKENLTVLPTSQSSDSTTLAHSPRRKSCPDILHPRDQCENKDSAVDMEGPGSQAEMNKIDEEPLKHFEYCTRNLNFRKKSTYDRRNQKKGTFSENEYAKVEDVQSKIDDTENCESLTVTLRKTAMNEVEKASDKDVLTSGDTKPEVKQSVSTVETDCHKVKKEDVSSKSDAKTNSGTAKPSTSSIVTENPSTASEGSTHPSVDLKSRNDENETSDVSATSNELTRKSKRISKKTVALSESDNGAGSGENRKRESSKFEKEITEEEETGSGLKDQSDEANRQVTYSLSERPKREIRRPSWRNDNNFVSGLPASDVKSNPAAAGSRQPSDDAKPSLETESKAVDEVKRSNGSGGKPKMRSGKPSRKALLTHGSSSENENASDEGLVQEDDPESSQRDANPGNTARFQGKAVKLRDLVADSALEDSASSSSLEFKGFSEEDAEPDSDTDCLGFSEGEIQKAAAQLRLLTLFIAKRRDSIAKADGHSQSGKGKMAVSSGGTEPNAKRTLVSSRPARKRKLSLPSTPEKEKKEALIGQCKAESKDSGLCESPEQPSFTAKPVNNASSEKSTPVNGTRAKLVRAPASRPINKIETLATADTAKTRNSQRYCASDLYKPRPSFARDVRAVKRTASAESATPGRAKKRAR